MKFSITILLLPLILTLFLAGCVQQTALNGNSSSVAGGNPLNVPMAPAPSSIQAEGVEKIGAPLITSNTLTFYPSGVLLVEPIKSGDELANYDDMINVFYTGNVKLRYVEERSSAIRYRVTLRSGSTYEGELESTNPFVRLKLKDGKELYINKDDVFKIESLSPINKSRLLSFTKVDEGEGYRYSIFNGGWDVTYTLDLSNEKLSALANIHVPKSLLPFEGNARLEVGVDINSGREIYPIFAKTEGLGMASVSPAPSIEESSLHYVFDLGNVSIGEEDTTLPINVGSTTLHIYSKYTPYRLDYSQDERELPLYANITPSAALPRGKLYVLENGAIQGITYLSDTAAKQSQELSIGQNMKVLARRTVGKAESKLINGNKFYVYKGEITLRNAGDNKEDVEVNLRVPSWEDLSYIEVNGNKYREFSKTYTLKGHSTKSISYIYYRERRD